MATKQVLGPKTRVTINTIDVSQYVTTGTLEDSRDEVDVTGFSENYREYLAGIGDAQLNLTFLQDTSSGTTTPDAVVYPLYANQTAGTIKITPNTDGTVVYTLIAKPYSWSPVDGGVGDANTIDVSFRNAGTAGLTRGTA